VFKVIAFLGGMAILFLSLGGIFYFQSHTLLTTGGTASGTVVRLESSAKGASYPVVHFQPDGAAEIEERGKVGTSPPEYKVGDTVPILYDKTNPKNWTINNWMNLYFLPAMFFGAGAGLTIAFLITLAYNLRTRRPSGPIQ
jgi:hypothetical protein